MSLHASQISDKQFDQIISEAMDRLPQEYIKGLDNVVITYDDEPSPTQRKQLLLRCNETLFGLYEGIPLTKRAGATSLFSGNPMTMPDKITLFKLPMLHSADSLEALKEQVRHTLWHEIAHFYGLDHDRIHKLES